MIDRKVFRDKFPDGNETHPHEYFKRPKVDANGNIVTNPDRTPIMEDKLVRRNGIYTMEQESERTITIWVPHFAYADTLHIIATTRRVVYLSHERLFEPARSLPRGSKVLMSGLGLGWDIENLNEMDNIESIVCVELNQGIIDLVQPHLNLTKTTIVHSGIKDYLLNTNEKFDIIWHDIFRENIESFPEERKELTELSAPRLKLGGETLFWRFQPKQVL